MMKCLLSICVCLGGLVALAGCSGTASAPPQPPPQVVQPAEPPQGPIAAAEPTEVQPEPQSRAAEPNETTTAGIDQAAAAKPQETVEPNEVRPAEPNATDVKATHTSETPQPQEAKEPNAPPADERDAAKPEATDNPQSAIPTPQSTASFMEAYAELLQSNVQKDGPVDYGSLRRRRLDVKQILMELGELDPNSYAAWSNDEKLAFWINAYNLKMLEIITRNYPIQSSWWLRLTWPPSDIRHITGIWTDYRFIVMGEEFTLAEVERRFFHRTFNEPRAYVAITCACWSGPPLRRTPYGGDHLTEQLDEQVKAFLASGQGLRIDRRAMVVHLSAIFKPTWRGKEFVARYGTDKKFKDRDPETRAVLSFLTGYLSREDAYFLETENYTIEYTNFDWRLNDTSRGY